MTSEAAAATAAVTSTSIAAAAAAVMRRLANAAAAACLEQMHTVLVLFRLKPCVAHSRPDFHLGKVLFCTVQEELVKPRQIQGSDHAVSEDTVALVVPKPRHVERIIVSICSGAAQALHDI